MPERKGSGLTRKLGPLPLWAWALIGLVLGYVLYRHFTGASGSSGAAQQTQTVTAQTPDQAMGLAPSAGAPADTGQTTSDLVSALGGQQASLLAALEQTNQDVVGLAASQLQYAQTQTNLGAFSTQTQPVQGVILGPNQPTSSFVAPGVVTTPSSPPAVAQAAKSSSAGGGAFGGVVSVRKLKSGSVLTTYASGRQVEQVPGKSPYVVRA